MAKKNEYYVEQHGTQYSIWKKIDSLYYIFSWGLQMWVKELPPVSSEFFKEIDKKDLLDFKYYRYITMDNSGAIEEIKKELFYEEILNES